MIDGDDSPDKQSEGHMTHLMMSWCNDQCLSECDLSVIFVKTSRRDAARSAQVLQHLVISGLRSHCDSGPVSSPRLRAVTASSGE